MKRKIVMIFGFLLISISTLPAQYDFIHNGSWIHLADSDLPSFRFRVPNQVEFITGYGAQRKSGSYSIDHEYSVSFLNVFWDDGTSERYLMLINEDFIVLYDSNTEPAFFLINSNNGWQNYSLTHRISASSTLTEGKLHFDATKERLGTRINSVWAVEGGVNERLYVNANVDLSSHIFISIGYVHYTTPSLFEANARPKRIRIFNANNETMFFEYELNDTPNYQYIDLDRSWFPDGYNGNIIIEILEVYPGIQYNHMCINSILSLVAP